MGVKPRGIARLLAKRLRDLRLGCRMSLEEVAKRMQFSDSKLSRIENCENRITYHELKSLLDIYGVTADRWQEYFDLLKASETGGWWRAYGLSDRGYVPLEADASLVRDFSFGLVPGLLQTADYARSLFRAGLDELSHERLKNAVAVRMIRQKRLISAQDPLELIAVMGEAELYRPVGTRRVMAAQLTKLLDIAALPTVTLHVLPTNIGASPSQTGSFSVLSFGTLGEPDMAYAEHPLGAYQSDKEAMVAKATLRFDRLRSDALSPDESVALIRRVAQET